MFFQVIVFYGLKYVHIQILTLCIWWKSIVPSVESFDVKAFSLIFTSSSGDSELLYIVLALFTFVTVVDWELVSRNINTTE